MSESLIAADPAARTGRRLPPFSAVLEEHRGAVYRFLRAAAGPHEADDCFQETFLAALRAYPSLRDASNLRGWLLTIATRKVIDAARARGRRPAPVGAADEVAAAFDPAGPGADQGLPDEGLLAAVRELPPQQRAAVAHRFVLDLPYAEVAAALGCTEEAARANVYQAMKRLRAKLGAGSRGREGEEG